MPKLALILAIVVCVCGSAHAQVVPAVEVFGGYSYLNVDGGGGFSRQSLNGWEASVSGNLNRTFAIETDVSGYYKSFSGLASVQEYGIAAGPRINFRPAFVHLLVGGAFEHANVLGFTGWDSGFAAAAGGGVQAPISSHVAIRASADYVYNRIQGFDLNNFRASAGIVFTFGGRAEGRPRGSLSPKHEEAERWCADETDAALLGIRGCAGATGFRVTSVKPESLAQRTGIGPGDIIVAVDDRPIRDARELETAVASSQSGTIRISYLIKGSWKTDREVKVR